MSKRAEERAFDAYPVDWDYGRNEGQFDWNEDSRKIYLEGYEQAEKDLALTWEDIRTVEKILADVMYEVHNLPYDEIPWDIGTSGRYEEVLRRFNEQRKR